MKAVKERHRLIFLDPVTGTAVPCGSDGQGYVLKLVAGLGKCAGLPLDLEGMPTEVVSMEEAHAIRMFEALLDSAASAATLDSAKSGGSSSSSASSETSRTAAATGKAYRALKDLVEEQCDDPKLMQCGRHGQGLPRAQGPGGGAVR